MPGAGGENSGARAVKVDVVGDGRSRAARGRPRRPARTTGPTSGAHLIWSGRSSLSAAADSNTPPPRSSRYMVKRQVDFCILRLAEARPLPDSPPTRENMAPDGLFMGEPHDVVQGAHLCPGAKSGDSDGSVRVSRAISGVSRPPAALATGESVSAASPRRRPGEQGRRCGPGYTAPASASTVTSVAPSVQGLVKAFSGSPVIDGQAEFPGHRGEMTGPAARYGDHRLQSVHGPGQGRGQGRR